MIVLLRGRGTNTWDQKRFFTRLKGLILYKQTVQSHYPTELQSSNVETGNIVAKKCMHSYICKLLKLILESSFEVSYIYSSRFKHVHILRNRFYLNTHPHSTGYSKCNLKKEMRQNWVPTCMFPSIICTQWTFILFFIPRGNYLKHISSIYAPDKETQQFS